ncbi:MAG: GNAT family N-acetyltransferase [Clostridia bacterium]|nr:GNAT family N-acetyltransferase [Clostridia bacterium]
MLRLTPFGLTWPEDWKLFCRLMEAYLQEVCTPEDCRREIAELHDAQLTAGLIRQSLRKQNPYCVTKILLDDRCIGLITYDYREASRQGFVNNLFILPEMRRQGHGSGALTLAQRHLRQLGAHAVSLAPETDAIPFYLHNGFAPDGISERGVPRYTRLFASPNKGGSSMKLLYYTRHPLEDTIYAPRLADSLHLALIEQDGSCTPLLHNSGIVYARAVPGPDGVLHPYSLAQPWMTHDENGWHVLARRIEVDGSPDVTSDGHLLHFTSTDLIHYTEQPLLPDTAPLAAAYTARSTADTDGLDLPEGCIPCGIIDVPEDAAARLRCRFTTPVNVANDVPAEVEAASPADLAALRAVARYSDGSTVQKRVDWCADHIDWSKPGRYPIEGRIHQDRYEFPMAQHKADPAICRWNGKYYFISTNDLDNNHTIFIRESDTISGLATAQQVCILDTTMYPHLGNLLWAPELHIIGDRLYCFHAGTPGPFVQEQSHVMVLRKGGHPLKAADWEMSRRVCKADGSPIYDERGITLDMTVFWSGSRLYAVWSQRQFQPVDQGAWLFIAETDPENPWQLKTEPQVLTVPEYGWENNHTFVVEGPFALYRGGKILLTYSGALVDATYTVGLMSIDDGADPLDPANWTKENCPLLSSRSVPGEYGPGHNAYVTDEDGLVWNTYHARPGIQATQQGSSSAALPGSKILFGARSSGIRRVHFNVEDFPILDMTEELDLKPELTWVQTVVIVK